MQPKELEEGYTEALRAEVAAHRWQWRPETIFIGGGTPSAIEPDRFERIFSSLPGSPWSEATVEAWSEATVEAAPGSFTAGKIEAWKRVGINRVSLGVQSFIKQELARTGRKHDAAVVERDVALLREAGIENLNIDLIAGLPGQTFESWRASLNALVRLNVPHASVYMLEIDDESRLGAEILLGGKRYGAVDVPSNDRIADFYEFAVAELARHGIHRYEISNFARPGAESIHNMKYWHREPYVGFGADAHSFDGHSRWQNVETVREYVERWRRGETPRIEESIPDPVEEKFFVGLRLSEGVMPNDSDWRRYGAAFQRFIEAGVMEQAGSSLRLTPRGIMVSNEIFEEFLPA